jgi:hypothetical protein
MGSAGHGGIDEYGDIKYARKVETYDLYRHITSHLLDNMP